MILKQKTFFILFFIALSFVFAINVKAATLTLIPESKIVKIGEEVSIDVKIDTEGESINAVQGTINFPAALLEATKIDRANSVFSFWVEEPTFSNEEGAAKFIGGTSKGVSGKSLQVFKLILKTRGAGSAELTLSDTAITASDGKGTNVLSRAEGVVIAIGATTIAPSPAASPVTQPQKVERIATPATKLPATPAVRVPLYPDVSQWYNYIGETIVLWDVPNDITQVATKLDQNPNTIPVIPEKELSTGKNLGTIKEGIWYIHVRFSNNVGWGSTAHYKLSLDATPPPPFEVKIDNAASDNPSPQITFDAHDALSGISNILVLIDGKEAFRTATTTAILPLQKPGTHTLLVRAFDRAGNSTEDDLKFEILPIEMPQITSINKKVILGTDDRLIIKGLAISGVDVIVTIEDKNKFLVLQNETKTNPQGEWEFRLDKELRSGDYFVSVTAKDSRGALSLPTEPIKVSFRDKPIISLFGLDITLGNLIIILVVAGVLAVLYFWRKTLLHLARSQRESIIISRDLKNAFGLIKEDLDKISGVVKKDIPAEARALEFSAINKKIGDTLDKIEKYLSEDIEKLEGPAENLGPMRLSLILSWPQIYERFIKVPISWVKQEIQNRYRKLIEIWRHKD